MFLAGLLTACFDPEPPGETPTATEGSTGTEGDCTPGDSQSCTCPMGGMGTQTCEADGTFGACECADTSADSGSGTGPMPECTSNADCSNAEGPCQTDVCDDGTCVVENLVAGTACGDSTDNPCNGADACDDQGVCLDNVIPEGSVCEGCDGDVCVCTGGDCGACETFAPLNEFDTLRAVDGWELTGDWRLRSGAPQSFGGLGVEFGSVALGTDGNRTGPVPGAHSEASYARTRVTVLPATLSFSSWHVDEGGSPTTGGGPPPPVLGGGAGFSFDTKRIRISIDDGASWQTVVDCSNPTMNAQPFCVPRPPPRDANDWDIIGIDVPAPLVGQSAIIELGYDTVDDCCGEEQGWYIDTTNFATECACVDDNGCAEFGGECGAGMCGPVGACVLLPEAAGVACGDANANDCNAADTCNGSGQCDLGEQPVLAGSCNDCPSGTCSACFDGACNDCSATVNDFFGVQSVMGWTVENLDPMMVMDGDASWGLYSVAPRNQLVDPNNPTPSLFLDGPVLGVNGNRMQPYPGEGFEHSRITSPVAPLPFDLTFDSWHVDEGGSNGSLYDNKIIEVSTIPGMWQVLLDCSLEDPINSPFPFCIQVNDRAINDWDAVSISLGMLAGLDGQIRITYNTTDTCCDFERGWYIDNLNFAPYCG